MLTLIIIVKSSLIILFSRGIWHHFTNQVIRLHFILSHFGFYCCYSFVIFDQPQNTHTDLKPGFNHFNFLWEVNTSTLSYGNEIEVSAFSQPEGMITCPKIVWSCYHFYWILWVMPEYKMPFIQKRLHRQKFRASCWKAILIPILGYYTKYLTGIQIFLKPSTKKIIFHSFNCERGGLDLLKWKRWV